MASQPVRRIVYATVLVTLFALLFSLYSTASARPGSQGTVAGTVVGTVPSSPTQLATCEVAPASATLQPGETEPFTYTARNLTGEDITSLVAITWEIVSPGVARGTLSTATGSTTIFTAGNNAGTFGIQATGTQGAATCSPSSSTVTIELLPPTPTSTPTPLPTSTPTPIGFVAPVVATPVGGSASEVTFEAGTTITSPVVGVTVQVKAGSVAGKKIIAYAPSTPAAVPALGPGQSFGSQVFDLEVWDESGTTISRFIFFRPITITLFYTNADVTLADGNPYNLVIATYDTGLGAWTPFRTIIDPVAKTATAQVTHTSAFALLAQEPLVAPPTPPTGEGIDASLLTPVTTPPIVGGVTPSSGFLVGLLIVAIVLIASGAYYLRQTTGRRPQ